MTDFIRPQDAARQLGVQVQTLRRWEREGRIAAVRTAGGQRRYRAEEIATLQSNPRPRPAPLRAIDPEPDHLDHWKPETPEAIAPVEEEKAPAPRPPAAPTTAAAILAPIVEMFIEEMRERRSPGPDVIEPVTPIEERIATFIGAQTTAAIDAAAKVERDQRRRFNETLEAMPEVIELARDVAGDYDDDE